jgi:hypothetical protein
MVVRLRGFAAHQRFQCDASVVSRTDTLLVVRTDDGHVAELRPHLAGSNLSPPHPFGHEICTFTWDREYIALAELHEDEQGDITIVPLNYSWSDDWEYVPPRP